MLPWVLIAALVGTGVWFVARREGADLSAKPLPAASPQPDESSSPTPTSSPSSTVGPGGSKDGGGAQQPLITDGVTVQVLDSVGSADAQDRMVDRLVALGFAVPFRSEASTTYTSTTVFWSYPDAKTAARRLAERFGWKAERKPGNLSPDVTLHVVVGRDEA